jgi:FtsP/CotA-like multicopper oxidase with cupredoxin domain
MVGRWLTPPTNYLNGKVVVQCPLDRRRFLEVVGASALAATLPTRTPLVAEEAESADYTVRIGNGLVELSPDHIVSTTLYNGQFPGPLIRFKEGQRTVVDIYNDTDSPELVHWHGQMIPSDVDGAAEEGSPFVPAHGVRRIIFVPKPPGFRFYHTHVVPRADLNRGTYTGQAGPVYIEPKNEPGAYDQEIFLVLKEFKPSFSRGGDIDMDMLAPGVPLKDLQEIGATADEEAKGTPKGYEVGYELFSINGKMLGAAEPIRVKQGDRVLFHVLNASATEIRSLALPGHVFRVLALDGNPVPTSADVPVLWLGTAERISAIVEMNHPGVFVLGDLSDDDRRHGMGIVIEYTGRKGKPQWVKPKPFRWDYTQFGKTDAAGPADEMIEMLIVKHNAAANGFNLWTLNGESFSMETSRPLYRIEKGRRYRLTFRNASDDIHPLHLHRHSFELVRVGGKPTAGVMKDVVMLGGFQEIAFDFVADNPGRTLFHCHQQLHMDFGFMALFDYV